MKFPLNYEQLQNEMASLQDRSSVVPSNLFTHLEGDYNTARIEIFKTDSFFTGLMKILMNLNNFILINVSTSVGRIYYKRLRYKNKINPFPPDIGIGQHQVSILHLINFE